jgi:DNA-binding CsgD family transcriptional regulator
LVDHARSQVKSLYALVRILDAVTSLSTVGHSDDLAEILGAWTAHDRAGVTTVLITGTAGVGKSRLAANAVAALHPPPAVVLSGTARVHSPAPYDWLAAVLDHADGATAFGDAGLPSDALAWLAQEPDVPRQRYAPDALLRIAVRAVRLLVGAGPAVILAEDLHAFDPASLNLLAALAAAADLPALLLITSRPPSVDDPAQASDPGNLVARTLARLAGSHGAVRVHLKPFSRAETADALAQIYPRDSVTDAVVAAAMRRTGGNPYLLTELLADLGGRDPAALADEPGPADEPALTAREQDVLAHIAAGMANKQIARSLGISVRTVAVHVSNLLRKTGTASRTDAAVWAVRHDIEPVAASADEIEPALAR